MKKKSTILLVAISLFLSGNVFGQTIYRSIASGAYDANTTWEISTDNGGTYAPTTSAQKPTTNTSVIIQTGHVIAINSGVTATCLNLTINSGGTLTDNGLARALRPGSSSSGTSGTVATVTNNGTLGGATDQIVLELPIPCATLTLTGTGVYNIGRIRAITGNSNNPTSVTTNHANLAQLIVDRDISLRVANNYAFSIPNSTVAATDVITYTINAGKTVFITDVAGRLENTLMATGGTTTGGVYAYNINGTLDLGATTTGTSGFIPYANAASAITLNVNGVLRLGALFRADTVNTSLGSLAMNINNGGLVDASLTTTLNTGKTGTASGNIFFVTTGTGALRRSVGATDINFPIGPIAANYNPAIINNAGTLDNYTVGVKTTIDNPLTTPSKVVNRQWSIAEQVAGGSNATIKLSWILADQAAGFVPTGSVVIAQWNGTVYVPVPATVSGSGTTADPYIAAANGFTTMGLFVVANADALPISFINLKATELATGIALQWSNATESNLDKYIVEKSSDGRNFSSLFTVQAKTNNGLQNDYQIIDATPFSGNNFYRIKGIEKSGSVKQSGVINIYVGKGKTGIQISPNPVTQSHFNLQLNNLDKGNYTVAVFNNYGQQIVSNKLVHNGGAATYSFPLTNLAKGIYTVKVTGEKVSTGQKVLVQ